LLLKTRETGGNRYVGDYRLNLTCLYHIGIFLKTNKYSFQVQVDFRVNSLKI